MSEHTGIMRAYSGSDDIPEQTVAVDLHRPEAFSGEPITMPLTIRDVQQQMEANLKRWYPNLEKINVAILCINKLKEEHREWDDAIGLTSEGEELADKVISECAYAAMRGIDLQSEIERKLAIVSARTDQSERDRAKGITAPEPPTLRPGATIRITADTKSINGLNLKADQLLRVTSCGDQVTARIGEHGGGMVATLKAKTFEVVG